MVNDNGKKARDGERYERAAHRVQTAIAFNPDRPSDQYKDLRTGIDMRASDAAGLATLLIAKGVFTLEEYLTAIADAAERDADSKEDELSIRHGINVRTV